ncbi:MAG: flagellar motor switch protein FliN [Deltaproteobacteria bacterium]|nr:flagellar motor switch protein FliN [Deltaproteobacteria bacterium]MBN2673065.1 flagellar motor switch protein FliN [Deltaproteobacteria bacterium]
MQHPQGTPAKRPINFLFDIPIELTVEVGRRTMTMGELVEVMPGTVVELDRPAGDNLDIFANGRLVARGEAVLVGERYGIRIMEVVGEDPFKQTTEDHLIGE